MQDGLEKARERQAAIRGQVRPAPPAALAWGARGLLEAKGLQTSALSKLSASAAAIWTLA
jgi:hypothetical protein